jgi:hypothetical protein
MTTTTSQPSPTTKTLRARGPEDLLAAVPVVLGFEPEESLAMMTFDGPHPFHARIDLPAHGDIEGAVRTLLEPAVRNQVGRAAFVLYTADAALARRVTQRLIPLFAEAGIRIVDCLRADGGRWWPAAGPQRGVPREGRPYDAAAHPFRAQAVMAGQVTLGSRSAVAATIIPDPEAQAATAAALGRASPLGEAQVLAVVSGSLALGGVADVDDLAALLLALRVPRLRDLAWCGMRRESAGAHVGLWSDVVRRTPEAQAADAAAVLAFSAWLAGQGALAWCALERCFAVAPSHSLGGLVGTALQHAMPPSSWPPPGFPDEPDRLEQAERP